MVCLGLIGGTLKHSLSPEINSYLLSQEQIEGTYQLYEVETKQVPDVIERMKAEHIRGLNVTIPHKETVIPCLDVLSDEAKAIGAVNTIYLKDGKTYGDNTDYIGVQHMFTQSGVSLKGKHIVILGSGGATRAIIYAMHESGAAKITVAARSQEKLQVLQERFPYITTCGFDAITEGDILIQTTPIGMYPKVGESVVDETVIRKFQVAADIVYNPLMTEFLQIAKREGLQVVTGLSMLVGQAIGSHEIWMERKLDYGIGKKIHDELAKRFV